jgi:Lar family restriction alleviation protein
MTIKPCPFCGNNELEILSGTNSMMGIRVAISCAVCGAIGPWVYSTQGLENETLESVINSTRWNVRAYE